jgi:hypothetical protein
MLVERYQIPLLTLSGHQLGVSMVLSSSTPTPTLNYLLTPSLETRILGWSTALHNLVRIVGT